jgi:hypothetical protein
VPVHAPVDAAPPIERVVVTLVATPAEATWTIDDAPVPGNPLRLERTRGSRHVAVASAPGYRETRLDLTFEDSRAENIALLPIDRPAATKPHGGHAKPPPGTTEKPPGTEEPPGGDTGLTIDKNNPFKHP